MSLYLMEMYSVGVEIHTNEYLYSLAEAYYQSGYLDKTKVEGFDSNPLQNNMSNVETRRLLHFSQSEKSYQDEQKTFEEDFIRFRNIIKEVIPAANKKRKMMRKIRFLMLEG